MIQQLETLLLPWPKWEGGRNLPVVGGKFDWGPPLLGSGLKQFSFLAVDGLRFAGDMVPCNMLSYRSAKRRVWLKGRKRRRIERGGLSFEIREVLRS